MCGFSVPKDVAVIGLDNIPLSALMAPTLTTVDVGLIAWIDGLIEMVIARLENTGAAQSFPTAQLRVIRRDSA